MIRLSVQTRNASLVSKRFEDLAKEIPEISKGRLYGRMVSAQTKLQRYPPKYAGVPEHVWVSEKQRRYVMWAIRNGIIKVPYQRSGAYGRKWKIEKLESGYRLRNTARYARWVAGTAWGNAQARIHQTRWAAMRQTIEEAIAEAPAEVQKSVTMVARRRGF